MLRLLTVFMLLLPEIASANYPVVGHRYKGIVHFDNGNHYIITEHTVIFNGSFGLYNNEGDVLWLTIPKK